MNFKGFEDWIEIFKGGKQVDSAGTEHDGDDLINKAIASFDPKTHEPPVVIGHPKDNAPAYGWVESLTIRGNSLFAKFRDVVPEFADMVRKGLFKKRSASFYPDGRLRHVGFLGAAPPAVKGLADMKFNDDTFDVFDFQEPKEKKTMDMKEFIEAMKFWKQGMEMAVTQTLPPEQKTTEKPAEPVKSFSEAELNAAIEKAREEEKAKSEAAIAEMKRKDLLTKRDATIGSFVEEQIKAGKLIPAWKDGVTEFMKTLDLEKEISFSESEKDKKQTAYAWFTDFVKGLPKLVEFGEIAGRDKMPVDAADKIDKLIAEKIKDDKTKTYAAAFSEVCVEHPELAKEYQQTIS